MSKGVWGGAANMVEKTRIWYPRNQVKEGLICHEQRPFRPKVYSMDDGLHRSKIRSWEIEFCYTYPEKKW